MDYPELEPELKTELKPELELEPELERELKLEPGRTSSAFEELLLVPSRI